MPEQILVGGIDNGTIKIYQAAFDGINAPEIWNEIMEFNYDVVDFTMAYLGKYRPYKKGTVMYTPNLYPWIFWIDSTGALYAQNWTDESTRVTLGLNVTSCSATMGINSVQGDWGYGLMEAWTTVAGSVFYAQLDLDTNVWGNGIAITYAPANAVEVVMSRVNDARMIFLVKDLTGTVTAMYFRSIAISLSNYEQLEVSHLKTTAESIPITFTDNNDAEERVEVSAVNPIGVILSILPPEVVQYR